MRTREVTLDAPGGAVPAHLAEPDGAALGGVVVIQEWWGLDDHIRSIADRLANEGFAALAPDLYRGQQPTEPDDARKLAMALDDADALASLHAAVAFLHANGHERVGVTGFCMGGSLAWEVALTADDVAAVVPFYGGVETAGGLAPRMPVQAHYAEHDRFPDEMLEAVRGALGEDFHRYPGTSHAFMNDTRPAYAPEAAALAWERMIAFLREHVSG
ncbi:MAG: dienelactone hydrolase family protein [Planctomycetaceae bacterium]